MINNNKAPHFWDYKPSKISIELLNLEYEAVGLNEDNCVLLTLKEPYNGIKSLLLDRTGPFDVISPNTSPLSTVPPGELGYSYNEAVPFIEGVFLVCASCWETEKYPRKMFSEMQIAIDNYWRDWLEFKGAATNFPISEHLNKVK